MDMDAGWDSTMRLDESSVCLLHCIGYHDCRYKALIPHILVRSLITPDCMLMMSPFRPCLPIPYVYTRPTH